MKNLLTSCLAGFKGSKARTAYDAPARDYNSSEGPALTALSSIGFLSEFLASRYDVATCGVIVVTANPYCPRGLHVLGCNAVALDIYDVPFDAYAADDITREGAVSLLNALEHKEPLITSAVRDQILSISAGGLTDALHLQATPLDSSQLEVSTAGHNNRGLVRGLPNVGERGQRSSRRWSDVHIEPAVICASRVGGGLQQRLTFSPYRPFDSVSPKAASPAARALIGAPVGGCTSPAAVIIFQPTADSNAPVRTPTVASPVASDSSAGRVLPGSTSRTATNVQPTSSSPPGLAPRLLSLTIPSGQRNSSQPDYVAAKHRLGSVASLRRYSSPIPPPPLRPRQAAAAVKLGAETSQVTVAAPHDPGSSEASRLREGTVLSGLSHIVTAFSPDGLQLLYQNELSALYYGRRQCAAACKLSTAAGYSSLDHGPGGQEDDAEGQDGGILAELFELEPAKLDCLLSEVCEAGRVWKGLVQVPASCCKDGTAASLRNMTGNRVAAGPSASTGASELQSPLAAGRPLSDQAVIMSQDQAVIMSQASPAVASTAAAAETTCCDFELGPHVQAAPSNGGSLLRTAEDVGVALTQPTRQSSLLLGTLDGPLDTDSDLLGDADPLATSTWRLMMDPPERLQDSRMSLRRRASMALEQQRSSRFMDDEAARSSTASSLLRACKATSAPRRLQQQLQEEEEALARLKGRKLQQQSWSSTQGAQQAAARPLVASSSVRGFGITPRVPSGTSNTVSPPKLNQTFVAAPETDGSAAVSGACLGGMGGSDKEVNGGGGRLLAAADLQQHQQHNRKPRFRSASVSFLLQPYEQAAPDLQSPPPASQQAQQQQATVEATHRSALSSRCASHVGLPAGTAAAGSRLTASRLPSSKASRMLLFASNLPIVPTGVQRMLQERTGSITSSVGGDWLRAGTVVGAGECYREPNRSLTGCDRARQVAGSAPPANSMLASACLSTEPRARESNSSCADTETSLLAAMLLSTANNNRSGSGSWAQRTSNKDAPAPLEGTRTLGSVSQLTAALAGGPSTSAAGAAGASAAGAAGAGAASAPSNNKLRAGPSRLMSPTLRAVQAFCANGSVSTDTIYDVTPDSSGHGGTGSTTRPFADTCVSAAEVNLQPSNSNRNAVFPAPDNSAAAGLLATTTSSHGTHGRVQQHPAAACWHEVAATRVVDPVTGGYMVVVTQVDVSSKVEAERHLALVSEAEHRVLEKIFPRHVLAVLTEEEAAGHAAADTSTTSTTASVPRDVSRVATFHPEVTLLFADIQGFTPMCKVLEPQVVMGFLNNLFTSFDRRLEEFGVYKVETIGDCYFVAGGLMHEDEHGMPAVRARGSNADPLHAEKVLSFAKAMLAAASTVTLPTTGEPVRMRVGIHSGPVVSGLVGERMPRFCLFGDTVNTTSRMESTGVAGCIHASEAAYRLLRNEDWTPTGGIEVKGKGLMHTYLWAPPDPACQAILQHHTAAEAAALSAASSMAPTSTGPAALGTGGFVRNIFSQSALRHLVVTYVCKRSKSGCASGEGGAASSINLPSCSAELSMLGLAKEVPSYDYEAA